MTKMTKQEALKQYFGYEAFRPGQEAVIDAILSGRDTLAVMPTGAGKSICYQVPAMLLNGITLVISPLISLMQDQVKALNAAGIHAAYINSSLSEGQITKALLLAQKGTYKIIYVAPERLETYGFLTFAASADISMVTVDEAHCISQWGQDFRPSYLKIVAFIRQLARRPVISAFTATATEEVKTDISCTLGLQDPLLLTTGFDRPNLYYEVDSPKKKDEFVLDYVREHPADGGIIYCATRKNVDSLFELLFKSGVSVAKYHAGMGANERKLSQDSFVYDRASVMVATNAFGMGIDKSNVRFVLHYNMPQSMENYYQEAGRAGRDGEEARCILLYSPQDVMIDRFLLEKKDFSEVAPEDVDNIRQRDQQRLRIMENYCQTTGCFRKFILNYFGENAGEECGNCGNCQGVFQEEDRTAEAKQVLECVMETRGRYGMNIITGILAGANRARLREIGASSLASYGALKDLSEAFLKLLITQMVQREYLTLTGDSYPVLKIGPDALELKDGSARVMVKLKKQEEKENRQIRVSRRSDSLTSLGFDLFEKLKKLRTEIAREANLPPYIVFTDRTLIDMCVKLPSDETEMLKVSGVAAAKMEKYGQRFLEAIQRFAAEHPGQEISIYTETEEADSPQAAVRKSKKKTEYYLSPEAAANFQYGELYLGGEIKEMLNVVSFSDYQKPITVKRIQEFLKEAGLIEEVRLTSGGVSAAPTELGLQEGIVTEERVGRGGTAYVVMRYPENIQRKIVEYFSSEEYRNSVSADSRKI